MARYIAVILIIFAAVPEFLPPTASGAEGSVKITPGKYRVTGTTKTNLDAEPRIKTSELCITQSQIDPETILPDKDSCSIKNLKVSGEKASFDIQCVKSDSRPGLTGSAEYSTTADSFKFKFSLNGNYRDKDLIINSEGGGERIGDC